ncbi:unnamed protein product [Amaranthus hypochondriacus]
MAATAPKSLSAIVKTPSSSSSYQHSLTYFSPNYVPSPKPKPYLKTLILKTHNFILSPVPPLLIPLHICHCSSDLNDTQELIADDSGETLDEIEQEQSEQELEQEENESEAEDIKGSVSTDDRKLFVGNLPYSMNSSHLSEIFAEAGQVQSIEIIYDKVTDRSRGFGFVIMGSIDEAKEAIRMFDGSQIGGRTVRVNFPEVPKGGERKVMGPKIRNSNLNFVDTPHKIYAGNLGWGVTTQGLRDAFANQEGFLSAKVIYERDSGRSRGFGFITFSSADAAESALAAMNGVELEGRPLRLNMASERPRTNTEAYAEQSS